MGWEMMIERDERLRVIQSGGCPVIHEMNHQEPRYQPARRQQLRETTGLSYVSVAYHVEGILSALSARAHL
jgi:hypothetical protein